MAAIDADARIATVCVVGAGPAGLAMARALKRMGLQFDVFERHAGVGGIWNQAHAGSTRSRSRISSCITSAS
jgi:cation diffusion facilitator CzcD-associated flavoprotein CzcO